MLILSKYWGWYKNRYREHPKANFTEAKARAIKVLNSCPLVLGLLRGCKSEFEVGLMPIFSSPASKLAGFACPRLYLHLNTDFSLLYAGFHKPILISSENSLRPHNVNIYCIRSLNLNHNAVWREGPLVRFFSGIQNCA